MKIRIVLFFSICMMIGLFACRQNIETTVFRPELLLMDKLTSDTFDSGGIPHTSRLSFNVQIQGTFIDTCKPNLSPKCKINNSQNATGRATYVPFERKLSSLEITSNHDFNDIPAGGSLKPKILSGFGNKSVDEEIQGLFDGWEMQMITAPNDCINRFWFDFKFQENPTVLVHNIKVVLTFADGKIFEATAENVTWK